MDACPRDAWCLDDEALGIDTEACDGCGLCTPVCPQGALSVAFSAVIYHRRGHAVALFACERAVAQSLPGVGPCLHAAGVGDLLDLYNKGVRGFVVCVAGCDDCSRGNATRLNERVAGVNRMLTSRRLPTLVMHYLDVQRWSRLARVSNRSAENPRLSRRLFLRSGLKAGVSIREGGRSEHGPAPFSPPGSKLPLDNDRQLLPFAPFIEASLCSGCNACARLCPNRAISLDSDHQEYRITAENCTGCRVCVDVCGEDAVRLKEWASPGPRRILLVTYRCRVCGVTYHLPKGASDSAGVCRICARRHHHGRLYQVFN